MGLPALYGREAQPSLSASSASVLPPQGAWIEDGLINAGGLHEPYIFIVRRGGQRLDARQISNRQQTEEVVRSLKEQGVEVFHTHFYKGFGIAAERSEMEATKRAAAIAHRYGMKVDTYIQWNSLMYETFFAEQPQAKDWVQYDAFGQPIMLDYGYQQSFRYRPCFSNQEYLDYLKKVVRLAVEGVKTDFIHFDNFDLNSEPYSCHCRGCVDGFRKRLQTKYSPEQREERFGFQDVSYVNPPLWNEGNPPQRLDIIYDPVFQEWIDYRCQMMADALGQMAAYIRSLNPRVVVEINCNGISGDNSAWTSGVDRRRLLPYTQAFWSEAPDEPDYLPDGRLISFIRTYKLARAYRNTALTVISGSEASMGECLAFNQTIGFAGQYPLQPEMIRYLSFYRKNRDLYVGTKDVASVAVFRSYPSITYHNSRAQLSAILAEQTLIQARIPFHLLFEEDLGGLTPSHCKVLILPDTECLSDEQLASIRKFVEAGGGLVATGNTGLYDSWRRLRVTPGLHGILQNQVSGSAYEEEVVSTQIASAPPIRGQAGAGRSVYLPVLEFDGPLPAAEEFFSIGTEFWKRPRNWRDLVESVHWAANEEMPLQVDGPEFLIANLVEQPEKRRRLVHFVNYNSKRVSQIRDIDVTCFLPEGQHASAVKMYSASSPDGEALKFRFESSKAVFRVPVLSTYCIIAIGW
ncbi:MAG TPA: hypothetical protein VN670_04055 [Acidobacteriaceae bacterium]|nr:hypothetical protein [Acidobacteriaceae bacterium]